MEEYRVKMSQRPHFTGDGEKRFYVPESMVLKKDEIYLTLRLVCDRRQFGECFRRLMPS